MAAFELIVTTLLEWKLALVAVPTLIIAWLICKFLFLDGLMSPLRNLPGPPPSMFLGNVLEIRRKEFLNVSVEWTKKYGGIFVVWLRPDQPTIYLTDVDLVKKVLVTNCYKYLRPQLLLQAIPSLGQGLLMSNGPDHARQRKMINPAFSYSNLKGMVSFMKTSVDDLVQLWKENLQKSHKDYADVMVQADLIRLAMDIIGQSAFGYEFKSVQGGDSEISKAFTYLTTGVNAENVILLAMPFMKYLPTGTNRWRRNARRITNEVVLKVIRERRQLKQSGQQTTRRDLLDIAMDMVDDQTGMKMDDEQLRAQVFTFLFAGHETTGASMSWTLYELAKQPEIQEKIRKEANEVLGDGSDITWAKLDELHYLSNVVKESMRLYPAVPILGRTSGQEDILAGYHIPTNTHVLIGIGAIHRSEKYWSNPNTFKPERFDNLTKEQESILRYIMMPFSFGPRICIGNKLATAEMRVVLATLLQNFTFSPIPGFPEVTQKISATNKPHPSLQLRIHPVKTEA